MNLNFVFGQCIIAAPAARRCCMSLVCMASSSHHSCIRLRRTSWGSSQRLRVSLRGSVSGCGSSKFRPLTFNCYGGFRRSALRKAQRSGPQPGDERSEQDTDGDGPAGGAASIAVVPIHPLAYDYECYEVMEAREVTEEFLWTSRLLPLLGYLPDRRLSFIRQALSLAFSAHHGQRRKSGEPYITHPVEVTRILAQLKMDSVSLCAGLLHDVVEDTETVTFGIVGAEFGPEVRRIVEGVTRFSKIAKLDPQASQEDLKAQDLRQLFVSMTEEMRIVVVKLADRLHNMRTLGCMPVAKQKRIGEETLHVFAPLARKLGLNVVKEELEDLAFQYAMPGTAGHLRRYLDKRTTQQGKKVMQAAKALVEILQKDAYLVQAAVEVRVAIRPKGAYALYRRVLRDAAERARSMRWGAVPGTTVTTVPADQQLEVLLQQWSREVLALQVEVTAREAPLAVPEAQLCYHVLWLVHREWGHVPARLKDFIANPQPNGYQALHTTVLPQVGAYGGLAPLQLQISTAAMRRVADRGIAADGCGGWRNAVPLSRHRMRRMESWLDSLASWQAELLHTMSAAEFVDCVRDDLLSRSVSVFTPDGRMLQMPQGGTVVDFAYHLGTEVGNSMVVAKVNGKVVGCSYTPRNADVVEVRCYSKPKHHAALLRRHREWLRRGCIRTRAARHMAEQYLQQQQHLLRPEAAADATPSSSAMQPAPAAVELAPLQPPQPAEEPGTTSWLTVECRDRSGLLAEVASIITEHGLNIVSYSGSGSAGLEMFIMEFQLEGSSAGFSDLLRRVTAVPSITNWSVDNKPISYDMPPFRLGS